jgi:hypothetical protein
MVNYTGKYKADYCAECRRAVVHVYNNGVYMPECVCECGKCEDCKSVLSIRSSSRNSETVDSDNDGSAYDSDDGASTCITFPIFKRANRSTHQLHKDVINRYQASMRAYVPEVISTRREKRALELGRTLKTTEVYKLWKEYILSST